MMDWRLQAFDKGIDDQVHMHYHPIVWLESGEVYGAEMLMRWHHPMRGVLTPRSWMTSAAQHGVLVGIFNSLIPGLSQFTTSGLKLSFNVTDQLLNDQTTLETLLALPERIVKQLCVEVHQLTFCPDEAVNETEQYWEYVSELDQKLERFKAKGFSVWLDDYGEGSRNMKTLYHPAVDMVKLDGCLVNEPLDKLTALVETIHAAGKLVLIEFLETEAQRDVMLAAGVDLAQGYLYARVLEAAAFEAFISSRHSDDT